MLIDAHNHLHQFDDPDAIVADLRREGIEGCVVNGTCEADWPRVAALAERHPDFIRPAFGLHPWHAHRRSPGWLDELSRWLDRLPQASVGECGLDGWVDEPALDLQCEVFLAQLRLARERDRPISIHALKAWGPLLDALAAEPPPPRGFLLHSFGGSPELARQLSPLGARFSFSGYFLHPRKHKVLESYRHVPLDRLLLESDAPDMLPPACAIRHPLPDGRNHPAILIAIRDALADHLGLPAGTLGARCLDNTRRYFD